MKKIILASSSPQRRKLLKRCGIKFVVHPSRAHEETNVKTTCADLVKHNALLKAKDVALHYKEGLVIGADTLVYDGHKHIIGKPKDLKEAKRILKQLFSHPHWVYTGVAILDAASQKRIVDYEKTKVFMNHLSDEEIGRYHNRVSPLDKAGGFDIEGHGGLFIRKIEGCYANVIGLPIAKLRLMLEEFGVRII
ncbi:MAG: septum formation protein Maf [Omnitrophica WOR_2 bacterium GWA2_47_8]|nr:MAG: septum formation protein Maf [Omnitrophica WOR_2 bacterium GWA2_47_8]